MIAMHILHTLCTGNCVCAAAFIVCECCAIFSALLCTVSKKSVMCAFYIELCTGCHFKHCIMCTTARHCEDWLCSAKCECSAPSMCALNGRRVLGRRTSHSWLPSMWFGASSWWWKDNINIKCKLPGCTIFPARHATMYLNMSKAVHVYVLTIVNKVPRWIFLFWNAARASFAHPSNSSQKVWIGWFGTRLGCQETKTTIPFSGTENNPPSSFHILYRPRRSSGWVQSILVGVPMPSPDSQDRPLMDRIYILGQL